MKPKTIVKKVGLGKYAVFDYETGEFLGYSYVREPTKEELSCDIDNIVLDNNGCINGDYCADMKEEPDFIDLLTDERYDMDDW